MNKSNYTNTFFLKSAAKIQHLPADEGFEVAFVGRSNAGKSSAINTITGINGLARTSKTPGRTQLINLFEASPNRRLVDLPGYGYAKVTKSAKLQWDALIDQYLTQRQCLKGLILLMDIRHPMKPFDLDVLLWCEQSRLPVHVLLTKMDKLKRGPAQSTLFSVKKQLGALHSNSSVQLFSALKRHGVDDVVKVLDFWLNIDQND